MLDLVFTVDDPVAWHAMNLKKNWSHYSFLKLLGPRIISSIQNNYGAGVYFNPLIRCDGKVCESPGDPVNMQVQIQLVWDGTRGSGYLTSPSLSSTGLLALAH